MIVWKFSSTWHREIYLSAKHGGRDFRKIAQPLPFRRFTNPNILKIPVNMIMLEKLFIQPCKWSKGKVVLRPLFFICLFVYLSNLSLITERSTDLDTYTNIFDIAVLAYCRPMFPFCFLCKHQKTRFCFQGLLKKHWCDRCYTGTYSLKELVDSKKPS